MASASSDMRPNMTIDTDDMGKEESLPTGCPGQYALGTRGRKTPKATATPRASALTAGGKVIAAPAAPWQAKLSPQQQHHGSTMAASASVSSSSSMVKRSFSKDSSNSMGSHGRADGAGRSRNRFSFGSQLAAPGPTSPSAAASFSSPCPSPSMGRSRARSRSHSEERMDGIQKKFQDQVRKHTAPPIAGPSPSKGSTSPPAAASRESSRERTGSSAGANTLSGMRPRVRPPRSPDSIPKLEGRIDCAPTFFATACSHLNDEEDKEKERLVKAFFRSPQDLDQEFEQMFSKIPDATEVANRSQSPAGEEELMILVKKARDQKDKTTATSSDHWTSEQSNDPLQAACAQRRSEQIHQKSPAQLIANRRHTMGDIAKRVWGKIAVARNIQVGPTSFGLKSLGSQASLSLEEETADDAKNVSNEKQPLQPSLTLPEHSTPAA